MCIRDRYITTSNPTLDQVQGRIHMSAGVHDHFQPVGHHTVLTMFHGPEHDNIVITWERRRSMPPYVTQFRQI